VFGGVYGGGGWGGGGFGDNMMSGLLPVLWVFFFLYSKQCFWHVVGGYVGMGRERGLINQADAAGCH
jgi:hypothetical protein